MRGWSFPIGRFFGVEVRIHAFFLLLLAVAIGAGSLAGFNSGRMLALWLMLLFAVLVREVARSLAAAWFGLELRGILLLPTGGLMTYATLDASERAAQPAMQRRMAVIGPIASIGFGLLLAAIVLAAAPGVNLLERPWITPMHLLRAMVWLNLLLGAINLLPAFPLDGGRVFHGGVPGAGDSGKTTGRAGGMTPARAGLGSGLGSGARWGTGLGQIIAIVLVLSGVVLGNMWLTIMGAFVLIGAHMENQGLMVQSDVDSVLMRDVMLTQFSTLSASDTLEDALQRAVHTLQDVFPVVRGGTLVGAVSRQNIVEALAAEGNSYVQGVMTRSFQTALPGDSLVKTLRRIMGEQGAQLVPVMEGERIVGIITPQNLSLSMGLLNQSRRLRRTENS
jgi:CBS domain-containing protein/Zn-dependent protease